MEDMQQCQIAQTITFFWEWPDQFNSLSEIQKQDGNHFAEEYVKYMYNVKNIRSGQVKYVVSINNIITSFAGTWNVKVTNA